MDSTLLSKIELDRRLPTERQEAAFATLFGLPPEDLEAKRIAERFWLEHKANPVAPKAAPLIKRKADSTAVSG